MRRWNQKTSKPPPDYSTISPIIDALENELRDKVKESNLKLRNTESTWPIFQINHQRTRYIYDMYYTYKRISRQVYDYCIKQKLADAALIAKWKKPGYERLCSTYVINPTNYKFGTTSICRVPLGDRTEGQRMAQDPTTGCFGCASGKNAAPRNMFGNKYGQNLAAVQIAREKRMLIQERKKEEREQRRQKEKEEEEEEEEQQEKSEAAAAAQSQDRDDLGDSETDDDSTDEDDYGPSPAAGVWAGSQKLEKESDMIANPEEDDDDDDDSRPTKKPRSH